MSDPVVTTATGSRIEHYGQHGETCFGCRIKTLNFGTHITSPPTHLHLGDHWNNNPVKDRIEELQATGRKVAAMEIANQTQPTKE